MSRCRILLITGLIVLVMTIQTFAIEKQQIQTKYDVVQSGNEFLIVNGSQTVARVFETDGTAEISDWHLDRKDWQEGADSSDSVFYLDSLNGETFIRQGKVYKGHPNIVIMAEPGSESTTKEIDGIKYIEYTILEDVEITTDEQDANGEILKSWLIIPLGLIGLIIFFKIRKD